MECWSSILPLIFSTTKTAELSVVHNGHCTQWLHCIPKEIPLYSYPLQAEWNLGLLKVDRRNGSLENFHDHTRNRTWNFPSCGVVFQPIAPFNPQINISKLELFLMVQWQKKWHVWAFYHTGIKNEFLV